MHTKVLTRSFHILLLVALLSLLVALPVLADEPFVKEFERVTDGGECGGWLETLIWGARANCPDRGGLLLWLGL